MDDPGETSGTRLRRCGYLAAVVVAFGAGAVAAGGASNMGFTRSLNTPSDPDPRLLWLSIPFRYPREGAGVPGTVDAEDLCEDLGEGIAASISAVVRWDEPSSTFVEHPCGGGTPFVLTVGTGYAVRILPGTTLLTSFTGGHDNDFSFSIPPSGDSQLSWLSVPYHLRIPSNGGDLQISAEDLCLQIGASEVFAIVRWDDATDAYQAYGCGSAFESPFEVIRGQSYGVVNRPGQTIAWQPVHF